MESLYLFFIIMFLCYLHRITVERVSPVLGSMYLMEILFVDAGITPFVIALYISTSPAYDTFPEGNEDAPIISVLISFLSYPYKTG